jgi:spermidine dehydrogenase
MDEQDFQLGMDRNITRRDFLDGVALAIAGAVVVAKADSVTSAPASAAEAGAATSTDYPPMRQGLRGFNPGAMEAGHAVRDGKVSSATGVDTGETYDLVVVGAGMAGLSAAYFYRQHIPNAKVLILDGCDDVGGHARRAEFHVDGHQLLVNGGTSGIWFPNTFPPECKQLLRDLGVSGERYYKSAEQDAATNPVMKMDLKPGMFFCKEKFGVEKLVVDCPILVAGPNDTQAPPRQTLEEFLAKTPFSDGVKAGLIKLHTDKSDHMAGIAVEEKVRRLKKMSYVDFLLEIAKIHPEAVGYILSEGGGGGSGNHAAGPDTFSAWFAWRGGYEGFDGMQLPKASNPSNLTPDPGQHIIFPDGNGGLTRLLTRALIPDALAGHTMEDSITARVNYDTFDRPENPVRIRLSSTAVRVKHLGDPLSAKEIEVTYIRNGRPYTVRGGTAVLACFNAIVPYLVPDLPEGQKTALHMAVRKPLVTTKVAVRNWRAFERLGVANIACPGMFFTAIGLSVRPTMGVYKNASSSDEPLIVNLTLSNQILEMGGSGLPPREQWKGARAKLQAISFETFERNIRSQLDRVLGPGGFSSKRDIAGIIINRWGHGYAGGSNALFDPDWSHRSDAPWIIGRQRFGRIAISNSDSAATDLTQAAWQQSNRAVNELITNIVRPVFDFYSSERDTAGEPGDYPNNF